MTDLDTRFNNDFFDVIHRSNVNTEQFMLERLLHQIRIIETANPSDRVVFLDSDILVLASLEKLFEGNFDIAVTIRDEPSCKLEIDRLYNNGVIFADMRSQANVLEYFSVMRDRLAAFPPSLWAWSGNEYIVRDILGPRHPGEVVKLGGATVRILPCSVYNYTPCERAEDLSKKQILHFYGNSKHLMNYYSTSFGWA